MHIEYIVGTQNDGIEIIGTAKTFELAQHLLKKYFHLVKLPDLDKIHLGWGHISYNIDNSYYEIFHAKIADTEADAESIAESGWIDTELGSKVAKNLSIRMQLDKK